MKRTILLLLLVSFAFAAAQSGTSAIQGSLEDLCDTSRSFLSATTMICCLPVVPLLILGVVMAKLYQGGNKTVKLLGKIAFGAGIVFGALAFLSIVIYLLVPFIVSSLIGMPMSSDPCAFTN